MVGAGILAKVLPAYLSDWTTSKVHVSVCYSHAVLNCPPSVGGEAGRAASPQLQDRISRCTRQAWSLLHVCSQGAQGLYVDGKIVLTVEGSGATSQVIVDHVVVAVGVEPNTQLAKKAKLEIDPIKVCMCVYSPLMGPSIL